MTTPIPAEVTDADLSRWVLDASRLLWTLNPTHWCDALPEWREEFGIDPEEP